MRRHTKKGPYGFPVCGTSNEHANPPFKLQTFVFLFLFFFSFFLFFYYLFMYFILLFFSVFFFFFFFFFFFVRGRGVPETSSRTTTCLRTAKALARLRLCWSPI